MEHSLCSVTTSSRSSAWARFVAALVCVALSVSSPLALAQDAELTATATTSHGYAGGAAVDPAVTFTRADGHLMVAIAVENPAAVETEITVQFQRADVPVASGHGGVHLPVPARRHYHTVARTGTARPGSYRAVVRNAEGEVIAQAEYTVTE